MSSLGWILQLASIGRTSVNHSALRQWMGDLVTVIAMTVVIGILIGALAVAALCGGYMILVAHGFTPIAAASVMALVSVLAIVALVSSINVRMSKMVHLPRAIIQTQPSIVTRASGVADAFLDGLMTRPFHR